jgi:hypothetical protein
MMSLSRQPLRQPERLALATTPSALRVHVHDA